MHDLGGSIKHSALPGGEAERPGQRQRIWQHLKGTRLLVAFVALDQLLKRLALWVLPAEAPVDVDSTFQLVLRLNRSGVGSWVQPYLPDGVETVPGDVGGVAINLLRALALALAWHRRWHVLWGIALGLIAGVPIALGLSSLQAAYAPAPETLKVLFVVEKGSSVALYLTLWAVLRASGSSWRLAAGPLAASVTGNFVDLVFPPYAVIDYIYSRPIASLFRLGVFNLADVAYLLAIAVCLVLIVRAALGRRARRWLGWSILVVLALVLVGMCQQV